jgi:glycosyltransferase involved in cell wall biosynthesis
MSDCVHFLGSRNDVPAIVENIDAFIYSTDHDTFGIAVVEAMAAGVPVFVNDWEVMIEITNNGEWATIYKTKDEQDLLEKFSIFLQNRDEYAEEAKKTMKLVREKFSIEHHIQELEKVYSVLQ